MKNSAVKILYFFFLVCSILSCSKEIDLLDDYKDIPIIYGVIDAEDSISYIRIQKAYLSDGNIYESAQIADSNLYSYKLDVKIQSGNQSIIFDTITIDNKDSGLFFTPRTQMYYAVTKDLLNINQTIELEVSNPVTGNVATSSAVLPDASGIVFTHPVYFISFESDTRVDFKTLEGIRIYQLCMRFHYMEMLPNDSSTCVYKYTDWMFNFQKSRTLYGGEMISFPVKSASFYANLMNTIPPADELERYHGMIELIVYTSEESLYSYYESELPSNSVVMHKVQFTNIDNGFGVFAGMSSDNRFLRINNQSKTRIRNLEGLNFVGGLPENIYH